MWLIKQTKIPTIFKYLLLIVVGLIIILCCSLFQHSIPVAGEYHYSSLLRNNFSILAKIIFFIISFGIGYYWNLNPWLTGICLFLIFPLTSVVEGTVYKGSHNLIPFEFVIHFIYAIPSIITVFIGRFIYIRVEKRKEKIKSKDQN
jgi:hypothetical protein